HELRSKSTATEDSVRSLLTAVENFCAQTTHQLERMSPQLAIAASQPVAAPVAAPVSRSISTPEPAAAVAAPVSTPIPTPVSTLTSTLKSTLKSTSEPVVASEAAPIFPPEP